MKFTLLYLRYDAIVVRPTELWVTLQEKCNSRVTLQEKCKNTLLFFQCDGAVLHGFILSGDISLNNVFMMDREPRSTLMSCGSGQQRLGKRIVLCAAKNNENILCAFANISEMVWGTMMRFVSRWREAMWRIIRHFRFICKLPYGSKDIFRFLHSRRFSDLSCTEVRGKMRCVSLHLTWLYWKMFMHIFLVPRGI